MTLDKIQHIFQNKIKGLACYEIEKDFRSTSRELEKKQQSDTGFKTYENKRCLVKFKKEKKHLFSSKSCKCVYVCRPALI